MRNRGRRTADALRVVDGLVESHLQDAAVGGRPLARLAAAVAIEHSGARWGALLFDEGSGLEPTFKLRRDLRRVSDAEGTLDRRLIEEARETSTPAIRDDRLAVPIVLGGVTRGVLYLDGLEGRGKRSAPLAAAVAQRIGTFLRSAELVERLARQERGLEALERLGALLADRQLIAKHLELVAETALTSTASDLALMARLAGDGRIVGSSLAGEQPEGFSAAVDEMARRLAAGRTLQPETLPVAKVACEVIWRTSIADESQSVPAGLLVVGRRSGQGYETVDRTLLRALANLVGGALVREEYFRRAAEDPLTETGTRLALQLSLVEAEKRSELTGHPFSVVIVDLDGFKEVNDRWGHLVGDGVLRGVAGLLRQRLRTRDFVARYGGDEFVLILPETAAHEARQLADELGDLVAAARFGEEKVAVSLSIGIATSSKAGEGTEALLGRADRALYASKASGRDRVTLAGETE